MKPSMKPFTNKQIIPYGAGTIAKIKRQNHPIPIRIILVFHLPNCFNSEMNLMPQNLLSMYPIPWLMIRRLWYEIPKNESPSNVATVNGLRYA